MRRQGKQCKAILILRLMRLFYSPSVLTGGGTRSCTCLDALVCGRRGHVASCAGVTAEEYMRIEALELIW